MGVVKNLMVRFGSDVSGLIRGMKTAEKSTVHATGGIKRSTSGMRKTVKEAFSNSRMSVREYSAYVAKTKQDHAVATQSAERLADKIRQMEGAYQTVKDTVAGLDLSQSLTKQIVLAEEEIESLGRKIGETQEKINFWNEIEPVGKQFRTDELRVELKNLIAESDKAVEKLIILEDAAQQLGQTSADMPLKKGLQGMQDEIQKTRNELNVAQLQASKTADKLRSMGIGLSVGDMLRTEMSKVAAAAKSIPASIRAAVTDSAAGIQRLGNRIKALPANALNIVTRGLERVSTSIRSIPDIPAHITNSVKRLGSLLKSIGGSTIRGIASLPGKLLGVGKSSVIGSSGLEKMVRSVRNIGIAALGMRVFRGVFGELQGIISSYISQNEALNASATSMKNQLGQALTPAINMVIAAMQRLMPVVTSFSNAINSVFTALFGNVKATTAAIGSSASSLETYGFDQITKVSDGGTGSSGASGELGEQSAMVQKLTDWIAQIKNAFVAGDWKGLGKIVGDGINSVLNAFDAADVGAKIGSFANNIFTTLHSALSTTKFSEIGARLGQMFTAAIQGVDWEMAGQTLGKFVTAWPSIVVGFIQNTDWSVVGQNISRFVGSALESVGEWFQSVDWLKLGDSLWHLISNINYGEIATGLFKLLGSGLGAGVGVLWGFINGAVQSIKEYFAGKIKEAGGNVAQGLLKGIADGLVGIGTWIVDNIFKPFLEGFQKAFQIHSPSVVMENQGVLLIDGLLVGIKNTWGKITGFFGGVLSGLTTTLASWWNKMKTDATTFASGVATQVKTSFGRMKDGVLNVFSGLWTGVSRWINTLIGGIESMVNFIISGINKMISAFNKITSIGDRFGLDLTISQIGYVDLPRLARGGIVDGATPVIAGEQGKEAIVPLENHTGWIKKLALEISNNGGSTGAGMSVTIPIYLSGRKVTEYFIKDINQITRTKGVCPIHV